MKTTAAQAALQIRNHLKALGIPSRVKSRNFSMGNAMATIKTLPPYRARLSMKPKRVARGKMQNAPINPTLTAAR